MLKLKFFVAGTGRCGTVFLSKLLTSVGLSCLHEGVFTAYGLDVAIERIEKNCVKQSSIYSKTNPAHFYEGKAFDRNNIVAESSYHVVPFLDHMMFNDKTIIHVVRHPYKVISSFVNDFRYFVKVPSDKDIQNMDNFMETGDVINSEPNHNQRQVFIYKYYPQIYEYSTPVDRAAMYYILCNKMIKEKSKNYNYLFYKVEDDCDIVLDFLKAPKNGVYQWGGPTAKSKKGFDPKSLSESVKEQLFVLMKEYRYDAALVKKLFV